MFNFFIDRPVLSTVISLIITLAGPYRRLRTLSALTPLLWMGTACPGTMEETA